LDGEALFCAAEHDVDGGVLGLAAARGVQLMIGSYVVSDESNLARIGVAVTVVAILAALLAHRSWQTLKALARHDDRRDRRRPEDPPRRRQTGHDLRRDLALRTRAWA
jgi:hypothetical protein